MSAAASAKAEKPFTADDFRAELTKIMPGYQWTVHRTGKEARDLSATGVQSSGFNRLSTLCVEREVAGSGAWYSVKSAGFGTKAPFLHRCGDVTLAKALRGLQTHYQRTAGTYQQAANTLEAARKATGQ